MPHQLAAALLHEYTQPGHLVLDPLAGIGTTLVEAVRAGRNAIAVEYEAGWAALAQANLTLAAQQGAAGQGRILCRDATQLPGGVPRRLRASVNLVLAAPPEGRTMPGHTCGKIPSRNSESKPTGGSRTPTRRIDLVSALSLVLAGCLPLLAPAGQVLLVARTRPRRGVATDTVGQMLQAALSAGLNLDTVRHAVAFENAVATALRPRTHSTSAAPTSRYTIAVFRQAC